MSDEKVKSLKCETNEQKIENPSCDSNLVLEDTLCEDKENTTFICKNKIWEKFTEVAVTVDSPGTKPESKPINKDTPVTEKTEDPKTIVPTDEPNTGVGSSKVQGTGVITKPPVSEDNSKKTPNNKEDEVITTSTPNEKDTGNKPNKGVTNKKAEVTKDTDKKVPVTQHADTKEVKSEKPNTEVDGSKTEDTGVKPSNKKTQGTGDNSKNTPNNENPQPNDTRTEDTQTEDTQPDNTVGGSKVPGAKGPGTEVKQKIPGTEDMDTKEVEEEEDQPETKNTGVDGSKPPVAEDNSKNAPNNGNDTPVDSQPDDTQTEDTQPDNTVGGSEGPGAIDPGTEVKQKIPVTEDMDTKEVEKEKDQPETKNTGVDGSKPPVAEDNSKSNPKDKNPPENEKTVGSISPGTNGPGAGVKPSIPKNPGRGEIPKGNPKDNEAGDNPKSNPKDNEAGDKPKSNPEDEGTKTEVTEEETDGYSSVCPVVLITLFSMML